MFCSYLLGPRRTAQILVYFAKKFVISSVTSVPSEFFPTIFWGALLIFKGTIILPWNRTNLCHALNLTDFLNYDLKENINQENFISLPKI